MPTRQDEMSTATDAAELSPFTNIKRHENPAGGQADTFGRGKGNLDPCEVEKPTRRDGLWEAEDI